MLFVSFSREQGVEMLLVKRDIQSKMSNLLESESPEPADVTDLSELAFVPGDVTLGSLNLGDNAADATEQTSSGIDSGRSTPARRRAKTSSIW